MKIHTFKITSTTGLLQHNPAGMTGSSEGKIETKKVPTPEEESRAGRYLTEDGKHLRFPAQAFKSSFVGGGIGRRIGKRSATSVLKASIFPAEEWCALIDPKTEKPIKADSFTIDIRRVVLKGSIGVLRARPKIESWACMMAFEVDETISNVSLLEEIGNMAGRMVGVGDFRPATGGPFGRYSVKLVA